MKNTQLLCLLFVPFLATSDVYDAWVAQSSSSPRDLDRAAVGYDSDTDTMWFFGGAERTQLLSLDLATDDWTDYGLELQYEAISVSANYAQIGTTLYILMDTLSNPVVASYDLSGMPDNRDHTLVVALPTAFSNAVGLCLASTSDFLFLIGKNVANTAILRLSDSTWLPSPDLNSARNMMACVADEETDTLYVFGGL